jgi:indole-3-glycerol phosphate synthase
MLKKVQIFKALDIEIKKQKGPVMAKDAYKGHHSLKEELSQPGISIIAETAGGNPLRGKIRDSYRASTHAKSLTENGANIICVATDRFLFYGEDKHLSEVRSVVKVPLLRRDFIFEEYQIEESKILGADGVILMAYLLETNRLLALKELAKNKNLDVLVEIASEEDLKKALDVGADIVCVLGRSLDTWQPNWEMAIALLEKIPQSKCLRILESSVCNIKQIQQLEQMGVHGVIIGDALLDEFYPGKKLAQILAGIENQKKGTKVKCQNIPLQEGSNKVPNSAGKTQVTCGSITNNKHTAKQEQQQNNTVTPIVVKNAKPKVQKKSIVKPTSTNKSGAAIVVKKEIQARKINTKSVNTKK